jgi:hypothetical protein
MLLASDSDVDNATRAVVGKTALRQDEIDTHAIHTCMLRRDVLHQRMKKSLQCPTQGMWWIIRDACV